MAEKNQHDEDEEMSFTFRLRVPPSFLKTIDDWRRHQPDIPSRSKAVRKLVEAGIDAKQREARKAKAK